MPGAELEFPPEHRLPVLKRKVKLHHFNFLGLLLLPTKPPVYLHC